MQISLDQSEVGKVYVEVCLPLPVNSTFTYFLSHNNEHIFPGQRAIVPFGKKKVLTGIIFSIHKERPSGFDAKEVIDLLDQAPIVSEGLITFMKWIASYYMAPLGEVLNNAIPSGFKISSQSKIQLNPSFTHNGNIIEPAKVILDILKKKGELEYQQVATVIGADYLKLIKYLIEKDMVIIFEELKDRYKPKMVKYYSLAPEYFDESKLKDLFESLKSSPAQEEIVLSLLESHRKGNTEIARKELTKELSISAISTLIKKGVIKENVKAVPRIDFSDEIPGDLPQLSEHQHEAFSDILKNFEQKDIVLLHGITGSGKTEIYIHLIKEALESGSQVLYLLPEIALSAQIVIRLLRIFGKEMGVFHSKYSDNERVEIWKKLASGELKLIIGVRSAVFMPFDNLGLIIVDEEHESSYKQYDRAPRYQARDAALMLAQKHHARVLLGSATPSFESYYQARREKYGLVELHKRFGEANLPNITLIDTLKARKKKAFPDGFSVELLEKLDQIKTLGEQAIIFQNRRGYAPYLTCEECAWVPQCPNCDISLTMHLYSEKLKCHYCGYEIGHIQNCGNCGSMKLKTKGAGTEKIEDDLKMLNPQLSIYRMDLDTTRSKHGYQKIIKAVEDGKADVLVGTQMVSKGLDFGKVSLVGIYDADRILYFPDFRAHERAFQQITQVSGRAGRRKNKGNVMIQTSRPGLPIFSFIIANDYKNFYLEEMKERQRFLYPPFVRMINIIIRCIDKQMGRETAGALQIQLSKKLGSKMVLDAHEPVVNKIRNQYLQHILIKIERNTVNLAKVKEIIEETSSEILQQKAYRKSTIIFDVDPY